MNKILICDFDGVFTNGKRYFNEDGSHSKHYNMKDGLAIKNIRKLGFITILCSGDSSDVTIIIAKRLGFAHIFTNIGNKVQFLNTFLQKNDYSWSDVHYIGDDLSDKACLLSAGYKYAPHDCNKQLLSIKNLVQLETKGGEGCISELYTLFSVEKQKKVCFIPARYGSTRLPGKPLLEINGKTIIQRVYEQVKQCRFIDDVIIVTDDEIIIEEINRFKGKYRLIKDDCLNGTERIILCLQKEPDLCDLVINVQGDEPFINPKHIDQCIKNYLEKKYTIPGLRCSTLHSVENNIEEIRKKSKGKVVLDKYNNIMYCSRNIIPGSKQSDINPIIDYYEHIGVFVYDKDYLLTEYMDENTKYQLSEDNEWLKIIEQGYRVNSVLVEATEKGVDTSEDYKYLINKYGN